MNEPKILVGDWVQVFIKRDKEKRGRWLLPRIVLTYDRSVRTITVPGSNGKTISAAIEDTRPALADDSLAALVQEGIDRLDTELSDSLDHVHDPIPSSEDGPSATVARSTTSDNDETSIADPAVLTALGDLVEVFWPLDNKFYHGTVDTIHADGQCTIQYDDGDTEVLDMATETWRYTP